MRCRDSAGQHWQLDQSAPSFRALDRPHFLTGNSLPFVIDRYELTGVVTGANASGLKIQPVSRAVQSAYPLVYGIATLR
jgi:hypothetical protein